MNTSSFGSHHFFLWKIMQGLFYFVILSAVYTTSVHNLTILGYLFRLVSFAFHFGLRMHEKKKMTSTSLLNYVLTKLPLVFPLKEWLSVISYGDPHLDYAHRYSCVAVTPLVEVNSQPHSIQ